MHRAERLWDILSRPEYASDDDGVDSLMTDDVLTYGIQGKACVDVSFLSQKFHQDNKEREVRRAWITRGK